MERDTKAALRFDPNFVKEQDEGKEAPWAPRSQATWTNTPKRFLAVCSVKITAFSSMPKAINSASKHAPLRRGADATHRSAIAYGAV